MFDKLKEMPPPGVLDYLTRIDNLLAQNIEVMQRLALTMDGMPRKMSSQELRQKVESGELTPYDEKELDMTSARTDEQVNLSGDQLTVATDGSLDGVLVKFNREDAPQVPIKYFNPWTLFNFYKLYITHGAQPGKTLYLAVGREAASQTTPQEVTTTLAQKFYSVRSDKDDHFTGAIAQNAKEDENLTGLVSNRVRITGIALQADENLDFRVIFWRTDGFDNTDLDADKFCGEVEIDLPANGFQVGGANQYYLDVRGAMLDYEDEDETNELHVSLQCLSAAGKSSGGSGEVTLEIYYEPRS